MLSSVGKSLSSSVTTLTTKDSLIPCVRTLKRSHIVRMLSILRADMDGESPLRSLYKICYEHQIPLEDLPFKIDESTVLNCANGRYKLLTKDGDCIWTTLDEVMKMNEASGPQK